MGKWFQNMPVRGISVFAALLILAGCAGVEYVDNQTLKDMGFSDLRPKGIAPKQYGALKFSSRTENGDKDETILLLRKYKSLYAAETMLFDHEADRKSMFDKSYLAVGADHKKKGVMLQLRFTY